jgi:hypothetical protein
MFKSPSGLFFFVTVSLAFRCSEQKGGQQVNIFEFLDCVYGDYIRATVNREKGIVRFETYLFYSDFELNEDVELWLHCQKEMEVIWE